LIWPGRVLFEDNHVIAVEKPPGVLSQADASGAPDVLTLLKAHIKERDGKPGNVFLGLVHRLDRNVGGAMVVAKTSKAAARLSEQIRARTFAKSYWAVVHGRPSPARGRLEHDLAKDARANVARTTRPDTGGRPAAAVSRAALSRRAVLEYEVAATREQMSLVRVALLTGRSHQIRAQLAAAGHAIVGDAKYGGEAAHRSAAARRASRGDDGHALALWSAAIRFRHPTREETIAVTSSPPPHPPWTLFREVLRRPQE
jgi:23S rRNA pseudouridine1911/1915/1917 synthase